MAGVRATTTRDTDPAPAGGGGGGGDASLHCIILAQEYNVNPDLKIRVRGPSRRGVVAFALGPALTLRPHVSVHVAPILLPRLGVLRIPPYRMMR